MLNKSAWVSALDRRKSMIEDLGNAVNEYVKLPLNVFWSGDGSDGEIAYNRIDIPASDYLFKHCTYGAGQGRVNHANAFLSHMAMFNKMLELDSDLYYVFEEDVYFIPDRVSKIFNSSDAQRFIECGNYDAIYLGWQQKQYEGDSDDCNEIEYEWTNGNWLIDRVVPTYNNISGLHAILMKRKFVERLARLQVGPVDSYLAVNMDRFKLYYFSPKIVGALASKSEAQGCWQDRSVLQ